MNVLGQRLYIHIVVPVKQIHPVVIPLLQVVSNALVMLLLDVEHVVAVVAGDDIFKLVSLLELQTVEVNVL
jgi:hypothetical protein